MERAYAAMPVVGRPLSGLWLKDDTATKPNKSAKVIAAPWMEAITVREEPKYDMGLTSVSWHADSSLQRHSTIGMYVAVGAVCPPHAAAGVLTAHRVVNTQLPPNRRPTQLCGLACCIVREQHRQRRRGYARHLCTTAFAAELLHAERLQPPPSPCGDCRKCLAVLLYAPCRHCSKRYA